MCQVTDYDPDFCQSQFSNSSRFAEIAGKEKSFLEDPLGGQGN